MYWQAVARVQSKHMATAGEYLQTWKLNLSTKKAVSAVFQFNNKEIKRNQKSATTSKPALLPNEPKHLGVTLDMIHMHRRDLESLGIKLISRIALLRRHVDSCRVMQKHAANRHFSTGQFNSRLLRSCLVLQCSHMPRWPCHKRLTPCELWLDACVLHQWIIFPTPRASNLLSFVTMEPHCMKYLESFRLELLRNT